MGLNILFRKVFFIISLLLTVLICMSASSPGLAKEEEKEGQRPEREISIAFEYPEIIISKGDDITVDIHVKNKGKRDENISFTISSIPPGWKAKIKTYSFSIMALNISGGNDKNVQFSAEPEKDTKPGSYEFKVDAKTADGQLSSSHTLKITMLEKKKEKGEIELTTSYPVLRGSNDAKFEFSLDVKNKTDKEDTFNLIADAPKNWRVNFKPSYEDKYISSLRLKDNESKSINVVVTPDRLSSAGEFIIPVAVSAGESKAEANLKVIITGTYKIDAGTPTGLLSLETQQGKTGNISIYVKNNGSAMINGVEFLSIKPENWKVEFDPEKIDKLETGEIKQVEVKITPSQDALVGDYAVGLNVKSERASDDLEMRVTVNASAAWAWIGIGIIILVIIGLFGMFISLGRR